MENRLGNAMRNKENTNPTLLSGSVMRKIHRNQTSQQKNKNPLLLGNPTGREPTIPQSKIVKGAFRGKVKKRWILWIDFTSIKVYLIGATSKELGKEEVNVRVL